MSAFVQTNRLKHALLLATTLSSKGRIVRPLTFGMESCVAEFMPAPAKHHKGVVSIEAMSEQYQVHNQDVSDVASDAIDTQVDDLVAYVRDVITTARERVVPMAKRIEDLLRQILVQFDDVFQVSSNATNSKVDMLMDYLDIPANIQEPTDIPAIAVQKSDAQIVELLLSSQVFPADVTRAFVESIDQDTLVRYYSVFYDGRFTTTNRLIAPSNASVAKDCLMVGLMASEYFARNVERAAGAITLELWNRTVSLMTRFCLARFAACCRAEAYTDKMQKVVVSVEQDGINRNVVLNQQLTRKLAEQDVPVETILGGVLVHGNEATQLTVNDFVTRRDLFTRRYEHEAPMLRLSVRSKLLAKAKAQLVSFVANNVNPSSDRLAQLRQDPYLAKLSFDNISAVAAYIAANYVVGNSMTAVYLEMMELARGRNDGTTKEPDVRSVAAAATVDFVALVLASNMDVGRVAPVDVVTRIED